MNIIMQHSHVNYPENYEIVRDGRTLNALLKIGFIDGWDKNYNKCEDVLITIVDGVFSGSEICPTCTGGKWKITKFWDDIADKNDDYNSMIKGWKYEVGYWTNDSVEDTEYFDDKEEAEDYLQECIKEERKIK
jgi:hypothetical protein